VAWVTRNFCGEAAAQVFLIGNGGVGDQAQDLAVTKRFAGIHSAVKICTHLYIYTGEATGCQYHFGISVRNTGRTDSDGTEGQGCRIRTIAEEHSRFWEPVMLLIKMALTLNGNTLPNRGMQK
jgi:hypothetical protein